MKRPTIEEWKQLKATHARTAQKGAGGPAALPDDLFLPDDYIAPAATPGVSERPAKRRQFRRFDETWAEKLFPHLNPIGRLALVLLAEADFRRHIKATSETANAAGLTLKQQRETLVKFEQLGLVSVERRGSGQAYVVTPLRLSGRPNRK